MYAADAVAEAARDTAGQTGVASDGPILAALAAIRRQNIASLSGRTPAQRKRQSLARKRLKPASQKRAGRSETGDIRCDADSVASDRFCGRPAVQPGRDARDDRKHDLRIRLDKDRSPTNRVKVKLIRQLELPEELLADFVLDHRIPLALGGAPSDPKNLELQPWDVAAEKDAVEACLARAVCDGKIKLDDARHRIWNDWRHVGADCDRAS